MADLGFINCISVVSFGGLLFIIVEKLEQKDILTIIEGQPSRLGYFR